MFYKMHIKEKLQFLKHRICIYPGHYYSPLPSLREISQQENMFHYNSEEIPGINLRFSEQKKMLEKCQKYYVELLMRERNERGGVNVII